MSETNNSDKYMGAPPPKTTLHLKRPVEQGSVRQSFSHGRSKTVVVEKVKRRILTPGEAAPADPAAPSCSRAAMIAAMRRCLLVMVSSLWHSPNDREFEHFALRTAGSILPTHSGAAVELEDSLVQ